MYSLAFRIYYQYNPDRLSACPLTIHALLHIADSILKAGPVWASWAYPMERYCGLLQPAIRSRRFPYASINRYVIDHARLQHIKLIYSIQQELSLKPPPRQMRGTEIPGCKWTHHGVFDPLPSSPGLLFRYHLHPTPSSSPVSFTRIVGRITSKQTHRGPCHALQHNTCPGKGGPRLVGDQ